MEKKILLLRIRTCLFISGLLVAIVAGCASPYERVGYKVSNKVVWQGVDSSWDRILKGVNPNRFKAFNDVYGTDGKYVYYTNTVVPGADPKTFVALRDRAAHDAHAIYWAGEPIKSCDPTSFHALTAIKDPTQPWYADSKCVYYGILGLRQVPGADPKTFTPITPYFGKDAEHVYFQRQILKGADAATFHRDCGVSVVSGRDAHQCYYNNHVVPCDCAPHSEGEWPIWRKRNPSDKPVQPGEYFYFFIDPDDSSELHRVNSTTVSDNAIRFRSNSELFGMHQEVEIRAIKRKSKVTIAQVEAAVVAKLRREYSTVKITNVSHDHGVGFAALQEHIFTRGNKRPESLAIYAFLQGQQDVYMVKWGFISSSPYYLPLERNGLTVSDINGKISSNAGICVVKAKVTSCNKWPKGLLIELGPSN